MSITICKVLADNAYDYTVLHINCWRDAYAGVIPVEYLDGMADELEQRVERCRQMLRLARP